MYKSSMLLLVGTLVLVLVVGMGCKSPEPEDTGPAVTRPATKTPAPAPAPVTPEPAEPEEAAAPDEPAIAEGVSQEIIDSLGVVVYEGAEPDSSETQPDGTVKAVFITEDRYDDVKAFYSEKLGTAPPGEADTADWTYNHMEMGAMGGNTAEWTAKGKAKLVTVSSDSGSGGPTKITIKVAPAAE